MSSSFHSSLTPTCTQVYLHRGVYWQIRFLYDFIYPLSVYVKQLDKQARFQLVFIIFSKLWLCGCVWNEIYSPPQAPASLTFCNKLSVLHIISMCSQVKENQWNERKPNLIFISLALSGDHPSVSFSSPRRNECLEGQRVKTHINHGDQLSDSWRKERVMEGTTM